MAYPELSAGEQVEVLRPVAVAAAKRFGLDPVQVRIAAHAYNTTFCVDTASGTRYALRVNTNSHSSRENVAAQQAWQRAIASETEVLVAEPLLSAEGSWYVEARSGAFEEALLVTAAAWLPGPDVDRLEVTVARELGRTMALLHAQSASWAMPAGAAMPRFDTPLFGDEDLLDLTVALSAADRRTLGESRERTARAFAAVYDGAPLRPLHADLHGGNLKWHEGRLAVFDFDDCGLGLPVLDLATSIFYLRGEDPALEAALVSGYAEVAPVPDVAPSHFEAMVAARQLLLANSLFASSTADLRGEAPGYLTVTLRRLRHWLATGKFTRVVPGS